MRWGGLESYPHLLNPNFRVRYEGFVGGFGQVCRFVTGSWRGSFERFGDHVALIFCSTHFSKSSDGSARPLPPSVTAKVVTQRKRVRNTSTKTLISHPLRTRYGIYGSSLSGFKGSNFFVSALQITSKKIANFSIKSELLDNNVISTAKLQVLAVDTSILADSSVTTSKLANGSILAQHLNAGQVQREIKLQLGQMWDQISRDNWLLGRILFQIHSLFADKFYTEHSPESKREQIKGTNFVWTSWLGFAVCFGVPKSSHC